MKIVKKNLALRKKKFRYNLAPAASSVPVFFVVVLCKALIGGTQEHNV